MNSMQNHMFCKLARCCSRVCEVTAQLCRWKTRLHRPSLSAPHRGVFVLVVDVCLQWIHPRRCRSSAPTPTVSLCSCAPPRTRVWVNASAVEGGLKACSASSYSILLSTVNHLWIYLKRKLNQHLRGQMRLPVYFTILSWWCVVL